MSSLRNLAILITTLSSLSTLSVLAEDKSTDLPPLPAPEATPAVLPTTAAPASSVTPTPTSTTAPAAPVAPAAADPNALLYADTVAPGPFEAKRKLLLASIKVAKKQGFGITSYLKELNNIEQQVKEGNKSPQLEERIDSVAEGLQDQLKRSQILKTQRPGPPIHSQASVSSGSGSAGGGNALSGLGGGNTSDMIQKLRAKYGDKIPPNIDPSMLNSDTAKEFLKRFKGGP
jgi:hypothetical protein